ncbi:hypothetical protein [Chitinivorax sp. B]|uniref:hypothetical protein n=1 Tax=Chitinivorax sp. B TaxID=2502235 RepID=UPI0010F61958|nr:hypothetical protein [Chitinivorax sp. B]
MRTKFTTICASLMLLAGTSQAAVIMSNFNQGTEDWFGIEGHVEWQASGGNNGGFLRQTDTTSDEMLVFAPNMFRGNLGTFFGGRIGFDAINLNGQAPDWGAFGTITLFSSAGNASADLALAGQPTSQWTSYQIALEDALWDGAALNDVLNNITGISLMLEYHDGVTEIAGMDNFFIASNQNAVSLPGNLTLMSLGLAVLLCYRRQPD